MSVDSWLYSDILYAVLAVGGAALVLGGYAILKLHHIHGELKKRVS